MGTMIDKANTMAGAGAASETGSFESFFEVHHAPLFGTLSLVTRNASEAEELMQEAFLKVWERWERIRVHPDPPGYLYRTAFNLFHSRWRRAMRAARQAFEISRSEDALARVEERDSLVRALRRVAPRQRAAIVLTDLLDLNSQEAGDVLGVKPSTVRVLASQGRAALRDLLEGTDE